MAKYKIQRQYIFSNKDFNQISNFLSEYNKSNLNLIRDHKGNTALHQAAYSHNDTKLLQKYLSYMEKYLSQVEEQDPRGKFNQFVNSYNNDGLTALHFAAYKGNYKALQVLRNYGADHTKATKSGQNVLHMAAQGNMIETFIYFQSLVDVNCQDTKKSTPLHWAVYMNSEPIVTYLLSRPNIKVDAQDENQQTSLHLATAYGHTNIVKKLLRAGADPNILNKKKETALKIAQDNEFKNIQNILDQKNNLFDCIKICLNLKTVYKPKNRSLIKPVLFITIFLLTLAFRFLLFQVENQKFQFCQYIQLGFFTVILLLYISLIIGPGKRKALKFIDLLNGGKNIKKVCLICAYHKPPRSMHCQICKVCVERYDHHCFWINNCVGKRNLKRFILFIVLFQIFLVYLLLLSLVVLTYIFDDQRIYLIPKSYQSFPDLKPYCLVFCFVYGIFSFVFSFPLLCLIAVHLKNIFLNKTTYQRFTKDKIATLAESTSHLLNQQMELHKKKKYSFQNARLLCKDDEEFDPDNINKSLSSDSLRRQQ